MKKIYMRKISMTLAAMMVSVLAFAQPVSEKVIIFVGADDGTARAEDQVCIDSLNKWVNIVYMGSTEFNDASADDLYFSDGGTKAEGIIISESIGSTAVPNFGLRDGYPVPCIAMEGVFTNDPANTEKWPLLLQGDEGGIWGYGAPEDVDVQWRIVEDMHEVTEGLNIGDIINYAPAADRGVPYLFGIDPYHIILATGARTEGGADNPNYMQDKAIALAYIDDPYIIYMNIAYTYLAVATAEYYQILHNSVVFLFDAFPTGLDNVRAAEDFQLSVFPNPAAGRASVSFDAQAGQEVSLKLYSVTGAIAGEAYRGLASGGSQMVELNTADYPSGIYMVEFKAGNENAYTKLVIK